MSEAIAVKLPMVVVEGFTAALVVGLPSAGFGNRIQIETPAKAKRNFWVAGADSFQLYECPAAVFRVFGETTLEGFHEYLCRIYGTGLPISVTLTLYTLTTVAPEEWEFLHNGEH